MEASVKQHATAAAATYTPQIYKSFVGALDAFLAEQCPHIGGSITRRALVASINNMVSDFFPETSHMKPGQMIWPCVSKDEKSSYGKSMINSEIVSVVLEVITPDDARQRAEGRRLREMKKDACIRLCEQSYKQGGCLSLVDLSLLLKISTPTASKYIREYEEQEQVIIPRRGTIHDMGPTLTHKKIIIEKLFIEHKSVQQTSKETNHSFAAIQRYISSFKRVLLCYRKSLEMAEISISTGISKRVVEQYLKIIAEYEERGIDLKNLEDQDAKIEKEYAHKI